MGIDYPADAMGGPDGNHILETDPDAEAQYIGPRREALEIVQATLQRHRLDGFIYPPLQVPAAARDGAFADGLPE